MIMGGTSAHHAFAVETFKTSEFLIATQRALGDQFMLHQNDPVSDRKSILL